jgi:guanine deaminase
MDQKELMKNVIELAVKNVIAGGGPFAAVVVRNGATLAVGTNRVTSSNDPTAHAEIVAIRNACLALAHFELRGCEVYCSCEPCPMCLGALYWARPDRVCYAALAAEASEAGFDDLHVREQILLPYQLQMMPIERIQCDSSPPFRAWLEKADKVRY